MNKDKFLSSAIKVNVKQSLTQKIFSFPSKKLFFF